MQAMSERVGNIAAMAAGLVAALAGLGLLTWWFRRWWRAWMRDADEAPGFTLQQLREWRAREQISDVEFERLRSDLIERSRGVAGVGRAQPAALSPRRPRQD